MHDRTVMINSYVYLVVVIQKQSSNLSGHAEIVVNYILDGCYRNRVKDAKVILG